MVRTLRTKWQALPRKAAFRANPWWRRQAVKCGARRATTRPSPICSMGRKSPPSLLEKVRQRRTRKALLPEGAIANFIIIFDVTSGTAGRIENVLRQIGTAFRVTDNVWCLASAHTALGVKNAIVPHISVREPVFVIDCSRGRTSWQNFTPELHARLTKAWVAAAGH